LDCAGQIARELVAREAGCGLVIEGLACRLLVETLRAWPKAQIEKGPTDPTPRLSRHDFIRAYEFMRWCRKDNFRLQHLCQILGSSEERFTRLFLAAVQATPAQFYNQMLMERGCEWLRDPQVPVKTVGIELGFKTTSHFIACFRRHFDMTPQDYRRRHAGLL
jgi:transcriptional regulator GlxA family with amidase domain